MKDLQFTGTSLDDLKAFPAEARRDAGFQLHYVQKGLAPVDWKPMKTVGPGAMEIRIHREGEWRIIYVARFSHHIYVLHAFGKKSQKTRQSDLAIARQRYREVLACEEARRKANR